MSDPVLSNVVVVSISGAYNDYQVLPSFFPLEAVDFSPMNVFCIAKGALFVFASEDYLPYALLNFNNFQSVGTSPFTISS